MIKPDLYYSSKVPGPYSPTWSLHGGQFINAMHASIFEKTQHLEGWQAQGDSQKLFEMGYYCGDAILEIGIYRGRSAAVSLLGALHNPQRRRLPQYYGLDISDEAILRSRANLKTLGLDEHCLLFCGSLESFISRMDVTPSMVFVDGDHTYSGAKRDLELLSEILIEGTPVLCHDYTGPEGRSFEDFECPDETSIQGDTMWIGVQRACHEWEAAGFAKFAGAFGVSGLYITTDQCRGSATGLRPSRFDVQRTSFDNYYVETAKRFNLDIGDGKPVPAK